MGVGGGSFPETYNDHISLYDVWILLGENCCWSLLPLKRVNAILIQFSCLNIPDNNPS